ncbi:MAG: hypothetical protein RSC31_08805 [Anaerovoracaceae bacterium]
MVEAYKNLFIGNDIDYETIVKFQTGWDIVHVCKEPYHHRAGGYTGRACKKNHPEYLLAERGSQLNLNCKSRCNPSDFN